MLSACCMIGLQISYKKSSVIMKEQKGILQIFLRLWGEPHYILQSNSLLFHR